MKKFFIILIPIVCGLLLVSYFYILPLFIHQSIIENAHEYKPYSVGSFDGKYILQTEKKEESTGVYATFHIVMKETNENVFNCSDNFRTMDLKSISWGENSLNVIVESGDVGTIKYAFNKNKWIKQ